MEEQPLAFVDRRLSAAPDAPASPVPAEEPAAAPGPAAAPERRPLGTITITVYPGLNPGAGDEFRVESSGRFANALHVHSLVVDAARLTLRRVVETMRQAPADAAQAVDINGIPRGLR